MDEGKIQHNLYAYLTQCLKLFKKRLSVLNKYLALSLTVKQKQQIIANSKLCYEDINKKIQEHLIFYADYSKYFQAHPTILNRFYLRIKEILSTFQYKKVMKEIICKYFSIIQQILSKSLSNSNFLSLFYYLFIYLPIQFRGISKGIYEFQIEKLQAKINPQENLQKNNKIEIFQTQNYQNHINFLQNQYKLLNILNCDQAQFRKRFFQIRQDFHRKSSILMQETMMRNKLINDARNTYLFKFQQYKLRDIERKKRKSLNKEDRKQSNNLKNLKVLSIEKKGKSKSLQEKQKKQEKSPLLVRSFSRQKRERQSLRKKKSLRNTDMIEYHNQRIKERLKTFGYNESTDLNEKYDELYRKSKISNQNNFKMKKIQIPKNKIELGPSLSDEQVEKMTKKKVFYKKTQDYFKKRYTIMAQEKISSLNVPVKRQKKSINEIIIHENRCGF